jgi:murein DD-endopeptidase MepM/ murein hydrolase activator NlpD
MRRFAYTPDVTAYLATEESGFIDISADIISGSVTRRVNAVSNAELVLQNPRRKYLKKIKPMDRIVIYLTRIHKPVLVFSGYIDRAPFDQLYPGPVKITASCTLKRLLHTYWDPGLPFVQRWLSEYGWTYNQDSGTMLDSARNLYNSDVSGGLGHMIRAVMKDVGGWPVGTKKGQKNTVHVMELPKPFITKTKAILKNQIAANEAQQEVIDAMIEQLLTVDGIGSGDASGSGGADDMTPVSNVRDSYPLPIDVAKRNYPMAAYGEALVSAGPTSVTKLFDFLGSKGSPLAPFAQKIMDAGIKYKVDPRLIIAISGAETSFGLTGNAVALHNAWGLGPGKSFPTWEAGIDYAFWNIAEGDYYYQEGRYTINEIQLRWAPEGAANDPSNLNSNWRKNVRLYYKQQGGDPDGDTRYKNQKGVKQPERLGKIGDVRASNVGFFENFGGTMVGRTFRMKPNPFGDDSMIFRAVYNKDATGLSCYIPGWSNKGTTWAQEWKSGTTVNLETSKGGEPFSGQGTTSKTTTTGKKGTFMYPIAAVEGFEHNVTPAGVFGNNRGDHTHAGNDIAAPEGTQLLACVSGTIIANSVQPGIGAGNYVILREAGTDRTYNYFHMQYKSAIKAGTAVKQGQPIGRVGSSGTSSGFSHLHFEYHPNGGKGPSYQFGASTAADPEPLLRKAWSSDMKQAPSADADADGGPNAATGYYGTTGVQINEADIYDAAASTYFGIELGFPAVANVNEANSLTGARALANDVKLFEWVDFMAKASGRNFQSMPNGDILFFYPDYFNWSGKDPYFTISPIETVDLSIDLGDEELTTHVFTTGDVYMDGQIDVIDKMASTVASVEQTETFQTLVNVNNFNALEFLNRYGARPKEENRPDIKHSLLQFMYGWMTFLELWSKQFYCFPEFTFMPELFPGGTVEFKAPHDMQFYVQEVTHNFDRAGGFSTSASFIAPSTRGGYNPAMALSNGGLKQKTIKKK